MPLKKEILIKYKKDCQVFIETGTLHGAAVGLALEFDFKQIYSCELSERLYNETLEKYPIGKVRLYNSDSTLFLNSLLPNIKDKSLFWLDAHYSGGITTYLDTKCPILNELNQIKQHSVKNHTILIDDVRLFGTVAHENISISDIMDLILEINHNYIITFDNDILIAEVL